MAFRFDSFVFDRQRGLLAAGEAVPLEPQAFDLLGYLIENRDRVVTRDELIERIWDGRIVSDAALSTQIRTVRRALGDDRTQQKYVRTLPKRGFQFVADVDPVSETATSGRSPRPRRLQAAVVGLVLALIPVGIGTWWMAQDGPVEMPPRPHSRSPSCPSTISRATRTRSISPMRSPRT